MPFVDDHYRTTIQNDMTFENVLKSDGHIGVDQRCRAKRGLRCVHGCVCVAKVIYLEREQRVRARKERAKKERKEQKRRAHARERKRTIKKRHSSETLSMGLVHTSCERRLVADGNQDNSWPSRDL
jgi:hypothetical protein